MHHCETIPFAVPNRWFRAPKPYLSRGQRARVRTQGAICNNLLPFFGGGGKIPHRKRETGSGGRKNRGRIGIPAKNGRQFFDKKVKCFFTCLAIAYNRLLRTCISACCTWFSTIPNCVGKSAFCMLALLTKYAHKGSLRPFFGRKRQKSPSFWPTATLW